MTVNQTPEGFSGAAPTERKGFAFKLKKRFTLPLFKWKNDETRYYKFDGVIVQGKPIKEGRSGDAAPRKEAAYLAPVIDLETGEKGQIILGLVLREILSEEFPDDGYVGKCFAISQSRVTGKNYNVYDISEIECPDTSEADSLSAEAQAAPDSQATAEKHSKPKK
jgi:hypothetical protein